jgi:serralysin
VSGRRDHRRPVAAIYGRVVGVALALSGCLFGTRTPVQAYQLSQRWTDTASGTTGLQGSPVTLTWSIVPDSTVIPQFGGSQLIATLDQYFGAGPGGSDYRLRPWFPLLEGAFQRWSDLAGISYLYEPVDDGLTHSEFPGSLNERGDIRLAGTRLDGEGGLLGFNFRPNNGDMVLDTSEISLFSDRTNNSLPFRNLLMHEAGHGLGLSHVDSFDSALLMESFYSTSFDGPQLDDIRGVHRAYGDVFERTNHGEGNGTSRNATDLGLLSGTTTASRGVHGGPDSIVLPSETEFLSIDDELDVDFFAFSITAPSLLDVQVVPIGPTYHQGPRGGQQSPVDSASVSDLSLALYAPDGLTILHAVNSTGIGQAESILQWSLATAGNYFVRVTGNANDVQLYQINLRTTVVPEPGHWLLVVGGTWLLFQSRRSKCEGSSRALRDDA